MWHQFLDHSSIPTRNINYIPHGNYIIYTTNVHTQMDFNVDV